MQKSAFYVSIIVRAWNNNPDCELKYLFPIVLKDFYHATEANLQFYDLLKRRPGHDTPCTQLNVVNMTW